MHTQPEYPFIARPAVVFLVLFVQEIDGFQIDQPIFPCVCQTYVTDITARYFYGVVRITIVRRGVSPLVDQSEIVPINVHGVLECVLRFFNQIKIGVLIFLLTNGY